MKSIVTLFIVATFATIGLKAQIIIGGGVGVNTSSSKSSDQSLLKPVTLGINFYPRVGYLISNKFAFGVVYGWGTVQTTYEKTTYTEQTIYKTNNWFITPFIRFYFAGTRKVSFILDNSFRYGGNISSTKVGDNDAKNTKNNLVKGFYIEPVISYNISEKFSVEMSIGNFRYTTSKEKTSLVKTSGYYYSLSLENISGRLIFKFGNKKAEKQSTLDKYN
jgi:hypothetical protein